MNLDKQEILAKTDYQYVYSKYINPNNWNHTKEGWYRTNSPFREDKNPSFTFNIDHGHWKDFADDKGDIIEFIERIEHTDFKGALEKLSSYAGLKSDKPKPEKKKYVSKPITSKQLKIFTRNLIDHNFPAISDIVYSRGINKQIIEKYQIGINRYYSDTFGCYICEVIVPYVYDESGNAVNYKRIKYDDRGSKAVEINKGGKSTTTELKPTTKGNAQIFPRDICKSDAKDIVLCEGEYDCLVLLSNGINAVTATAGALTFNQGMADLLTGKNVTIIYDYDEPGEKGSATAYKHLVNVTSSVKIANWSYFENIESGKFKPKEKYDVSDYFGAKKDKKDFLKMLESAVELEEISTSTISDKEALIDILYDEYIYRGEKLYRLVHQNVVNHITTVKKICSTRRAKELVFFEYDKGFWNEKTKQEIVRYVARELLYFPTNHVELNQVVNLLGDMTYVLPDVFDARLDLVNLDNFAFNTETLEPEPHNPDHYFTCKNSYEYNKKAECPDFLKAIKDYSREDQTWMDALGEIFGYCLTGTYPYQKMFWWHGSGRNGKGTLIRVLEKLVGIEYSMPNLNPKTLDGQFDKADLIGKKLAYEPDMEPVLPNSTVLKQLTGGDRIRTNRKYMSTASFFNTAKIILLMNRMPDIPPNESLEPIFKRLYLLPFEYRIEAGKEDSEIEERLEKELPGIFNWAIKSLARLKTNKQFTVCKRGLKVIELYKGSANSYMQFFTDRVIFEPEAKVWGDDIWDAYKEFMKEHHGGRWYMSNAEGLVKDKISFGRELRKQFDGRFDFIKIEQKYSKEHKQNKSRYIGLRLKSERDYENFFDPDEENNFNPNEEYQDKVPF